jgi:hypothetical protein
MKALTFRLSDQDASVLELLARVDRMHQSAVLPERGLSPLQGARVGWRRSAQSGGWGSGSPRSSMSTRVERRAAKRS